MSDQAHVDGTVEAQGRAQRPGLRRTLSVWQAVGLSVALMAPSMAVNINPQVPASQVGRAVPLAFLLAAIGVLLVAYGFVRLCQHFRHAGSVYAFVGATLGPRSGVVAGVGLLGTYFFYAVVTATATGLISTDLVSKMGFWSNPPTWAPYLLGAGALAIAWLLAVVPAQRGTSTLLGIEGATVALILLVIVLVLVKLIGGHGPRGQTFTLSVFSVPPGTGASALFLGVVFGFLSFAGFEAAATLGEETRNPRRDIPRAILGTAIFGGVYFTVVTAVEMMAFGTDADGVAAFAASSSLVGDIGTTYLASWIGDLVTLGAAISAFGCCLACVVGASRMLFALGRDIGDGRGVGRVSDNGTPANAIATVVGVVVGSVLLCALAFGARPFDTFGWAGTIGTLILLVVYLLATFGAIRLVFVQRKVQVAAWELIIPVAGIVVLGYTLYRNVIPYPTEGAARWLPIVAALWLLLALLGVLAAPGLASRLGRKITEAEGLASDER